MLSEVEDEAAGGVLSFCGRCPSGNIGSGVFFLRSFEKNGFDAGDFLGVVAGLVWECLSFELTSDREDSDWRVIKDGGAMPLEGGVADDVRGEAGSSRGASDERPFSSAKDLRGGPCERFEASRLSRGRSLDRRNRLIREVFFLGPVNSPVGAVVMISGAVP